MASGSASPTRTAASSRLGKQTTAPSVQRRNAAGLILARKAAEPGSMDTARPRDRAWSSSHSATSSSGGSQNV
jgi:hypothetical protein